MESSYYKDKRLYSKPKGNGYRSLRAVLDLSECGTLVISLMEIQIRTREMVIMAEGGVASHSLYKGCLTDPEEVINSLGNFILHSFLTLIVCGTDKMSTFRFLMLKPFLFLRII